MILVTGPTGWGKSTTLYATLNIVSKPEINIITVEDPVEYRLPGINQVQTNNKAGLTFASALRSVLRSDPDVVLIGEVRDAETAHIAVEASLTGHLVLSTLHTNDAPSAIVRLTEMGIEPFLVGSALDCVLAQRLARKLCNKCKEAYKPTPQQLLDAGFPWQDEEIFHVVA
jgi:type IV pilus assembly protein PilB